jgi:cobalt-zinc-cadmium efflux system protein
MVAFVNAVLFLIPIGILAYEAFKGLFKPDVISSGVITWVAAFGIIINGTSAFLFFRQKHELNSKAAYLHLRVDTLVSLGVVIAGILISCTHLYWLDSVISVVILIVILFSTWGWLRDSLKIIIDAMRSLVLQTFVTYR